MKFFAHIRSNSAIDKLWRAMHRVSGELLQVKFTLQGGEFVSAELAADEVVNLRHHPSVELEALALLSGTSKSPEISSQPSNAPPECAKLTLPPKPAKSTSSSRSA